MVVPKFYPKSHSFKSHIIPPFQAFQAFRAQARHPGLQHGCCHPRAPTAAALRHAARAAAHGGAGPSSRGRRGAAADGSGQLLGAEQIWDFQGIFIGIHWDFLGISWEYTGNILEYIYIYIYILCI